MKEKFTLFWGGPASQWAKSLFVIDNVLYSSAEQYMMFKKAELFGDNEAIKLIMDSNDPRAQKAVGRLVRNFDQVSWEKICKKVVYDANMAKFTQNPKFLDWLKSTAGTTLVEASPYDKIWGIGLSETDPRCLDRSLWRGTNWLGEIITQVREDIIEVDNTVDV